MSLYFPIGFPCAIRSASFGINLPTNIWGTMMQAPKDGNIEKIRFNVTAVTTGATLRVSVQTVSGGNPTGTLWSANTEATVAVSSPGWHVVTLTANAAVSKGEVFALVLDTSSGSPTLNVEGAIGFGVSANTLPFLPYTKAFSGSWSNASNMIILPEYDDGTYAHIPALVFGSLSNVTIANANNPDEAGLRFRVSTRVDVVGGVLLRNTTTDLPELVLYDDADTVLESFVDATSAVRSTSNVLTPYLFPTSVTLSPGAWYRLIIKYDGSESYDLWKVTSPDAALVDGWPHLPGDAYWTQRQNGGAWSDDTLAYPLLWPLIDCAPFGNAAGFGGGTRAWVG